MYKGKSNGTPFKKRWMGVRCLVAFEIRSGSYRGAEGPTRGGGGRKAPATKCRS